jgi:imidazolonepropionase-like amidohydrolase
MRLLVSIVVAFFSLAPAARASDLKLIHATIYTSPDQPPIHDGAILIHNGRITAVGLTATITAPPFARHVTVYDCTGLTITAGFWNSHVHFLPPQLLHAQQQPPSVINTQLQTMFTQWGFTSVFDVSSPLANTSLIRSKITAGTLIGPRILTTGEPFWAEVPVYVQQYVADNHIAMPATTSVAAAIARVDQQVHDGADGVKIFAGSIEPSGVVLLPADIAKAVVDEAHHDHRLVFSHPSSIKGVELSLDSGADILAHVTTFEGPWSTSLLQRMLAAHMSLIPTLTLFDVEAQKGHASPEETQRLLDLAVGQLRSYASAGGQILFGTDIGYMDHYDTAEEFTLMSKAGMNFPQILASLTTAPAARFGHSSHSGRIAPGFDADLVVLQSDPSIDITALSHVRYTIRAGEIIYTLHAHSL